MTPVRPNFLVSTTAHDTHWLKVADPPTGPLNCYQHPAPRETETTKELMGNAEHPAPTTTHHPDTHHRPAVQTGTTMATEPRRSHRKIPDHWQLFFDQKGIRSINHLAEIAGVAGMTANRLVMGDSTTRPEILRQIARALRVEDAVIYGLAGWPTTTTPWEPPAEAEAMTDRQRKAVTDMIRAFVQPALEEEKSNVHQLRPSLGGQADHGLAAWRRPDDDRPSYQEHLDGLGEEPQD